MKYYQLARKFDDHIVLVNSDILYLGRKKALEVLKHNSKVIVYGVPVMLEWTVDKVFELSKTGKSLKEIK